jgi:hypothetical protein
MSKHLTANEKSLGGAGRDFEDVSRGQIPWSFEVVNEERKYVCIDN